MRAIFLAALILKFFGPVASAKEGVDQVVKDGRYFVPVAPEHAAYATFTIKNIEIKQTGSMVDVEYTLPLELTGVANSIEFSGTIPASGPFTLTGANAVMNCPAAPAIKDCPITYQNLTFDAQVRSRLLDSISTSPAERLSREEVAKSFEHGGEPGGILSVDDY